MIGSGWYPKERWTKPEIIIRWTGPEKESTIFFLLNSKSDYNVQFNIIASMSQVILQSVKLKVNNEPISF